MIFNWVDWTLIGVYLAISLGIGLYFRGGASKSMAGFFLGGRNLHWSIAGLSLVATTFAADTPLAVTELVMQSGIAGNWLWWSFAIGGFITVFFFANLWRRSAVVTDNELITLRYSGKPAFYLRGFRAAYIGLFINSLIIAWINVAMMSILEVFFGLNRTSQLVTVGGLMLLTSGYSAVSGLMGVAVTDVVQFIIAMAGCIVLAVLVLQAPEIGGLSGLVDKVKPGALQFFPSFTNASSAAEGLTMAGQGLVLGVGTFLSYVAVQWWASWYPGAEPGGGGYVAQRMLSSRTEKDAVYATLLFQVAHYAIRPWPWILVALAASVLYPTLEANEYRLGYVYAMRDFLPAGLRGLMLVAFLAAYMSSIATQLNVGASYLVNDIVKPNFSKLTEAQLVGYSRIATVVLMLFGLAATTQVDNISEVWSFLLETGAGLGFFLMLRWFYWRVNAWAEIAAMVLAIVGYSLSKFYFVLAPPKSFLFSLSTYPNSYFFTVGLVVVGGLITMYFTPAEPHATLKSFALRVRPAGLWPKDLQFSTAKPNGFYWAAYFAALMLTFGFLFGVGSWLLFDFQAALPYLAAAVIGIVILGLTVPKMYGQKLMIDGEVASEEAL